MSVFRKTHKYKIYCLVFQANHFSSQYLIQLQMSLLYYQSIKMFSICGFGKATCY